ncbi:hypothetical protein [Myroides odoratimimus]|uniref:hypothetical protein n=1 Tax=Myroides odoratimimus TaxID=76832 RepID=UPI00209836ED|nr:hypothetical protein [Myroides odoratimimus]MCO7721946.1 hypothetical protein [Myroides odoratimimus]MDM1464046.1 hypothetical protein [Myroides odoratimimus]MDM1473892.1 hypothetical protein [Myroides odoratimimus]
MRKLLLSISLIFLISCSKSPQDKALKLIDNNFKKTLNDYNSYELIEISKLDSSFTTPFDNPQFVDSLIKFKALEKSSKESLEEYEKYKGYSSSYFVKKRTEALKNAKYYIEEAGTSAQFVDSFTDTFKPAFNGWEAVHKFRANNTMGAKIIGLYKWKFNIALDSIIKQEDLNK